MEHKKYYKELYFDVPVIIYPESAETELTEEKISGILDELGLPFEADMETIENIEMYGDEDGFYSSAIEKCGNKNLIFAGNLNFVFDGLVDSNRIYEDYYFDIPDVLYEVVTERIKKISKDLKEHGLAIEYDENKDYYLSLPDNPKKIELNDLFYLAFEGAVLSDTEEIRILKRNLETNLIDAYLITGNKEFIKGKGNVEIQIPKEKIKERINELSKIPLTKKDMAKAAGFIKNPIEAFFLDKEERNKAVGFLMVNNITKEKKIEKNKFLEIST